MGFVYSRLNNNIGKHSHNKIHFCELHYEQLAIAIYLKTNIFYYIEHTLSHIGFMAQLYHYLCEMGYIL